MKTEISMKQFVAKEAERLGVKSPAIFMRIKRGKYPDLKIRRVNARVVYVRV